MAERIGMVPRLEMLDQARMRCCMNAFQLPVRHCAEKKKTNGGGHRPAGDRPEAVGRQKLDGFCIESNWRRANHLSPLPTMTARDLKAADLREHAIDRNEEPT